MYRHLRQNIRTIATLLPLIVLTLCISLVVYKGDGTVLASQLFQSPVEPEEGVPPKPPQEKPKPEKVLPPTVQRPTPVPIPSPTSPPPQPQPAEQAAPTVPTVPPAPDQPPPEQQQAQPQAPVPTLPAAPPPAQVELVQSEMVIDSGLLIDSVLVYISYAWLCCGVIAFVMIPIVFLVLYILGVKRSRNANE